MAKEESKPKAGEGSDPYDAVLDKHGITDAEDREAAKRKHKERVILREFEEVDKSTKPPAKKRGGLFSGA